MGRMTYDRFIDIRLVANYPYIPVDGGGCNACADPDRKGLPENGIISRQLVPRSTGQIIAKRLDYKNHQGDSCLRKGTKI